MYDVKQFRRYLFPAIALLSLLILAAAIGEEVLTRSSNEFWYFHTVRSINAGLGNSAARWEIDFTFRGILIEHEWNSDPNRPYAAAKVLDDWQVHHESTPAYAIHVEDGPDLFSWQEIYNPTSPFQMTYSVKGFGKNDLGVFFWHITYSTFSMRGFVAAVPIWMIGGASALVLVAWEMRHFLRRRLIREIRAICANCGYDLRATPARCPECGTEPTSRK